MPTSAFPAGSRWEDEDAGSTASAGAFPTGSYWEDEEPPEQPEPEKPGLFALPPGGLTGDIGKGTRQPPNQPPEQVGPSQTGGRAPEISLSHPFVPSMLHPFESAATERLPTPLPTNRPSVYTPPTPTGDQMFETTTPNEPITSNVQQVLRHAPGPQGAPLTPNAKAALQNTPKGESLFAGRAPGQPVTTQGPGLEKPITDIQERLAEQAHTAGAEVGKGLVEPLAGPEAGEAAGAGVGKALEIIGRLTTDPVQVGMISSMGAMPSFVRDALLSAFAAQGAVGAAAKTNYAASHWSGMSPQERGESLAEILTDASMVLPVAASARGMLPGGKPLDAQGEALKVLGLPETAAPELVDAKAREILSQTHPERFVGQPYPDEAKDTFLKTAAARDFLREHPPDAPAPVQAWKDKLKDFLRPSAERWREILGREPAPVPRGLGPAPEPAAAPEGVAETPQPPPQAPPGAPIVAPEPEVAPPGAIATAPPEAASVPVPEAPSRVLVPPAPEIHPEAHEIGAAPQHVGGPRWEQNRGGMPGEPMAELDVDPKTGVGKAAVVEIDTPRGAHYEARDADGTLIGRFTDAQDAAKAAEAWVDQPPAPRTGLEKQAALKKAPPTPEEEALAKGEANVVAPPEPEKASEPRSIPAEGPAAPARLGGEAPPEHGEVAGAGAGLPEPQPAPEGAEPAAGAPGGRGGGGAEVAVGEKPERKFSSTQIDMPKALADKVRAFGRRIPDELLAPAGREENPHATVLYGLHSESPEEARRILASEPPAHMKLGPLQVFQTPDGDALHATVESPDLHRLHGKLAQLEHTDTHPEYKPHVNIAYLKPGAGAQFVGDKSLEGEETTGNVVTFSSKEKKEHRLALKESVPPEHADLIEKIVAAARKPKAKVVPSYELEGTNGNWYGPNGFPSGVNSTGKKRLRGFVYQSNDGSTYAPQHFPTADDAMAWQAKAQAKNDDNLRQELQKSTPEALQRQAAFWLKEKLPPTKYVSLRDRVAAKKAAAASAGAATRQTNLGIRKMDTQLLKAPPKPFTKSLVPEVPRPLSSRASIRDEAVNTGFGTPEQVDAAMSVLDRTAEYWAKQNPGKKAEQFYPEKMAGVTKEKPEQGAQYQHGIAPPTFFSQAIRTIEDKMPERASPEQVRGILSPQNGVKPEELEWIGLDDVLRGKLRVTKQEVLDHLRANQVEVRPVVHGGKTQRTYAEVQGDIQGAEWRAQQAQREGNTEEAERHFRRAEELEREAEETELGSGATKFGSYTLPGGENYREVLLTKPVAPEIEPPDVKRLLAERDKVGHEMATFRERAQRSQTGWTNEDDVTQRRMQKEWNRLDEALGNVQAKRPQREEGFKSGHFSEPNILTHLRLNDRTDAQGKKTLFIEEIQSDWHQHGKKEGYSDAAGRARIEEIGNELERIFRSPEYRDADYPRSDDLDKKVDALQQERMALNYRKVPNAPFKKTWPELAFKWALRHAVENGYDSVSWTTGEQQAERYDLSKQIGSLRFIDNVGGGIGRPNMEGPPGRGSLVALDTNGRRVIDEHLEDPADIEKYVGKEVARRLLDSTPREGHEAGLGARVREVHGLGLRVGGEGMKGFYDQILPATVNKLVKKWGGKVELRQPERGRKPLPNRRGVDQYAGLSLDPMDRGMSAAVENDKIAKAVIGSLPIDVMDLLTTNGISAQSFVRDPKVFLSQLSGNRKVSVASGLRSALSETSTRVRAGLDAAYKAGLDREVLPALRASDIDADVATGILFPKSLHIGGGNEPARVNVRPGGTGAGAEAGGRPMAFGGREDSSARLAAFEKWHEEIVSQRGSNVNLPDRWELTITQAMRESVMKGMPLFQENAGQPKAALSYLSDGRALIHAMQNPDISSLLHESTHLFESVLSPEDRAHVGEVYGKDWSTTKEGKERFAEDGEAYFADGKSPTPQMRGVFEKFKAWLTDIYRSIKNTILGREIHPKIREVFDKWMRGGEEEPSTEPVVTGKHDAAIASDGTVLNAEYFDYLNRLHPDSTLVHASAKDPVLWIKGKKKVVGAAMGLSDQKIPPGLAHLVERVPSEYVPPETESPRVSRLEARAAARAAAREVKTAATPEDIEETARRAREEVQRGGGEEAGPPDRGETEGYPRAVPERGEHPAGRPVQGGKLEPEAAAGHPAGGIERNAAPAETGGGVPGGARGPVAAEGAVERHIAGGPPLGPQHSLGAGAGGDFDQAPIGVRLAAAAQALSGKGVGPERQFRRLGYAKDVAGGYGLNQLAEAAPDVATMARKASSAQAKAHALIRETLPKLSEALGDGKEEIEKFFAALADNRLQGIVDKYREIKNSVAAMDADQIAEGADRWHSFLDAVEGRRGFEDADLTGPFEEAMKQGDMAAVRRLVSDTAAKAQDEVGTVDLGDGDTFKNYTGTPEFQDALKVYKDDLETTLRDAHALNDGYFTEHLGPLKTYFPLSSIDERQNIGAPRRPAYKKPPNPNNPFATGLGEYDTSVEAFHKNLARALRQNGRAAVIQEARDAGILTQLKPGASAPPTVLYQGREFTAKTVETGVRMMLNRGGKVTHIPSPKGVMPEWAYDELKPILEPDLKTEEAAWKKLASAVTVFNMGGPTDAVYHSLNLYGTLMLRTPFVGTDIMSKIASNVPTPFNGARALALVANVINTNPASLKNAKRFREMVENGQIPSRYGTETYSREYAALTGAEYGGPRLPWGKNPEGKVRPRLPISFSPMIFGPSGIDVRARLLLDQIGEHIAKESGAPWTPEARFEWGRKLGNYVKETEGRIERAAKGSGFSPFYTAGRTMNWNGLAGMLGAGHIPLPEGESQVFNKYRVMMVLNGIIGSIAVWAIMNKLYRDKWPWEDKASRLGQIALNDDDRKSPLARKIFGNDTTKVAWVNAWGLNPLLSRGLRISGVRALLEGAISGTPPGKNVDQSEVDVLNGLAQPFLGPPTHMLTRSVFGVEPWIKSLQERNRPAVRLQPAFYDYVPPGLAGIERRLLSGLEGANPISRRILDARTQGQPAARVAFDTVLPNLFKGPYRSNTPLERELMDYTMANAPAPTKEHLEKVKLLRKLDEARGKEDQSDYRAILGQLHDKYAMDARSLRKLDAHPEHLIENQFRSLSLPEAVRVFRLGTEDERTDLAPLLRQKLITRPGMKDLEPDARAAIVNEARGLLAPKVQSKYGRTEATQ